MLDSHPVRIKPVSIVSIDMHEAIVELQTVKRPETASLIQLCRQGLVICIVPSDLHVRVHAAADMLVKFVCVLCKFCTAMSCVPPCPVLLVTTCII